MLQRGGKRKFLKPDQRARLWTHKIKDAAFAVAGRGLGRSLRGLPKRIVTDEQLRSWTLAPDVRDAYETFWDRVKARADDHRPESVPQADCFALFALTKAIGARQALEIGTHLGFSTLHIAAALSDNGTPAKLTTVDIVDVNDEEQARYKSFGASMSARQRLRNLGLEHRVEFAVSPSEAFLKRTSETYDIIFVDGDHSEVGAYFDIAWSLMRLSDRGIIVLHDVNDPDDPTPGLDGGQYGVHWALHRLRSHVPDIGAVRLRSITPPGSGTPVPTSLAVVTRR
jgi:predicted O-methyltransferase YrrM